MSLWDIVRIVKADRILALARGMWVSAALAEMSKNDAEVQDKHVAELEKDLLECRTLCETVGLPLSRLHTTQTLEVIQQIEGRRERNYQLGIATLTTNVENEMSLMVYFTLDAEHAPWFRAFTPEAVRDDRTIDKTWEPIFDPFPSVKYDALESFRCYALRRNTASVFHLMRVLELGLAALGGVFGVSLAHTNWHKAIEQIENRIRGMHTDPKWRASADCKEQQEFYSQAASYFMVFKDAWRNYTAHARGKHDDQEASDIMTAVRAFMQKLVQRGLHE